MFLSKAPVLQWQWGLIIPIHNMTRCKYEQNSKFQLVPTWHTLYTCTHAVHTRLVGATVEQRVWRGGDCKRVSYSFIPNSWFQSAAIPLFWFHLVLSTKTGVSWQTSHNFTIAWVGRPSPTKASVLDFIIHNSSPSRWASSDYRHLLSWFKGYICDMHIHYVQWNAG